MLLNPNILHDVFATLIDERDIAPDFEECVDVAVALFDADVVRYKAIRYVDGLRVAVDVREASIDGRPICAVAEGACPVEETIFIKAGIHDESAIDEIVEAIDAGMPRGRSAQRAARAANEAGL